MKEAGANLRERKVIFTALAPLGERVARRGVFISRGETGDGGLVYCQT